MKLKTLLLSFLILTATTASRAEVPAEFNVATYNLRQLNGGDNEAGNGWERRYPVIATLVQFHDFDIFGTQEGYKSQLEQLRAAMPGYDYIGIGRDDGKEGGEHSAIFYRTDLFEVVDHGDFWLSETPDRPGLGWDAVCNRICTWGHFRHIPSGKEFLFFNLHADHIGKRARVESAALVKSKMQEFGSTLPVFLTGDFNVDQTHSSYAAFNDGSALVDSYTVGKLVYALNGTYNAYHTDDYTDSRIDHIFVSPSIEVKKYGVLTDTYRTLDSSEASVSDSPDAPREITLRQYTPRNPSDHYPVKIVVKLP